MSRDPLELGSPHTKLDPDELIDYRAMSRDHTEVSAKNAGHKIPPGNATPFLKTSCTAK